MSTFEVEIGDDLYELEVEHFQAEGRNHWRTNCDPGELIFGHEVTVYRPGTFDAGKDTEPMALDAFLKVYAEYCGHNDVNRARNDLEQKAYEEFVEQMQDGSD